METKYSVKNYSTLVVEEVIPEQVIPEVVKDAVEYDYDFLLKQKKDIQKQWDDQVAEKMKEIDAINAARQKEIDIVTDLLKKFDELGVKGEGEGIKE